MMDDNKLIRGGSGLLSLILSLGLSLSTYAATNVDVRKGPNITASAAALGLSEKNDLRTIKTNKARNGFEYTRKRQYYQGIPVWGENIVVVSQHGAVKKIRGRVVRGIGSDVPDVKPAFSLEVAQGLAKYEYTGMVFRNENAELVIYIDDAGKAHLAYAVSFFADAPHTGQPTRPHFIIDANTKQVLKQWEGLTHAEVGTGPGGNLKTGQKIYGIDYGFLDVEESGSTCTMNTANVRTVNLNHGTSGNTPYSFLCYENTYKEINGGYSPLNDAHYFGGVVYDLYNSWYGVPPLNFQLGMKVHYSSCYDNAFWDGSAMHFGDGCNYFYPLVSLDVSAHEVSHGFTEQNSDLVYSGQSGGINEAFSDIAGEAAEYFMNGSNDFEVGAEIFKAPGQALRYMYNPPLDGVSIGHADDYYPGMDVHYSSGVFNKAFYLLATTAGWDVQMAFDCFVGANQNYWTPNSDFVNGGEGVYQACDDMGYPLADVEAAFADVGVDVTGGGNPGGEITLLTPDDGATLPTTPDPTFSWDGGTLTRFKIEFSPTSNFVRGFPTLGIPKKRWMNNTSTNSLPLQAWERAWNIIQKMEQINTIVYWRVVGKTTAFGPEFSEVRSFTIQ